MCFYSDDYPEFAGSQVVKARKPHKCDECRAEIGAGASYQYHTGKSDGAFYAHKVCRRCAYDTFRVVEHELAEGCEWSESWPTFGSLVGHLRESGLGQTRPADVPASFRIGDMPAERTEAASHA